MIIAPFGSSADGFVEPYFVGDMLLARTSTFNDGTSYDKSSMNE